MVLLLITTLYMLTGIVLVKYSPLKGKLRDDRLPKESWQELSLSAHGKSEGQIQVIMKKRKLASTIFKVLVALLWPVFLIVLLVSTIQERFRTP